MKRSFCDWKCWRVYSWKRNKEKITQNYNTKTDFIKKNNKIEKKIIDHNHDKYITTLEFNKFAAEDFDFRWKRANLASQSDIDKNSWSNINKNLTKELIKKFQKYN